MAAPRCPGYSFSAHVLSRYTLENDLSMQTCGPYTGTTPRTAPSGHAGSSTEGQCCLTAPQASMTGDLLSYLSPIFSRLVLPVFSANSTFPEISRVKLAGEGHHCWPDISHEGPLEAPTSKSGCPAYQEGRSWDSGLSPSRPALHWVLGRKGEQFPSGHRGGHPAQSALDSLPPIHSQLGNPSLSNATCIVPSPTVQASPQCRVTRCVLRVESPNDTHPLLPDSRHKHGKLGSLKSILLPRIM